MKKRKDDFLKKKVLGGGRATSRDEISETKNKNPRGVVSRNEWKFLLIIFAGVFLIGFLSATCEYSGSGDWNITVTDDCTNSSVIYLVGNLTIYGNLTLDGATLLMNLTNNGSVGIYAYPGSRLNIIGGTNITSNDTNKRYTFYIDSASSAGYNVFYAKDSFISEAGTSTSTGIIFMSGDRSPIRDINITLDNMTITKIYNLRFSSIDEFPIIIKNSYIETDYRISFEQYTQNSGVLFENNTIVGGSFDGINLYRASDFIIKDNNITLSGGTSSRGGIFMTNTVDNVTIYNNNISFHATGIYVSDNVNNLNITGNKIFNNSVYDVKMSENTGAVKNITFKNNQVYNAGTTCVYLSSNSANAIFENNNLTNCGTYGFEFGTLLSQDWNITVNNTVDNLFVYYVGGQNGNASDYVNINNYYSNTTALNYSKVTSLGVFNIYNSSYVNLNNINTYYGYHGIEILNSSNIILNNSQAHLANDGSTIGTTGLKIYGCNYSYVYNSNFNGNDYGISIHYSNNTLMDNVNVTNNRDQIIIKNSNYLSLYNIVAKGGASQLASLYFYKGSAHGFIENFTSIITGAGYGGILLYGDTQQNELFDNITFYNVNVSGPRFCLWLGANATNITFYNSTFVSNTGSATYRDIKFGPNNGIVNISLVNCTYNVSDVEFNQTSDWHSMFYDYKYLDVYVQDGIGSAISGANVNMTNVENVFVNETTNANGEMRKTLLSYFANDTASTNYSNYTINVSKTNYNSNSSDLILTLSSFLNLTLTKNNAQICTLSAECSSGYCVHGYCRASSTYCGDGYCDTGETCSSCSADCKECATTGGTITYRPTESQLKQGYSKIMKAKQKVKVTINEQTKTIEVKTVDVENKKVEVSIGESNYEIVEGEVQKIDTNSDGYYDLQVSVSEVKISGYANLEFKEIYEEVPAELKEQQSENVVGEENISFWKKIGNFFRKVWDWIVFWK